MTKVEVQPVPSAEREGLLRDIETVFDRIRQRAYQLFAERGYSHGKDTDDWLTAEREILYAPASELIEHENEFELRVAVAGFEPEKITVSALPEAVIVEGKSAKTHEAEDKGIVFSEISERSLFRRFELPEPVDPNGVIATLDHGLLRVMARKAAAQRAASMLPASKAAGV